MWRSRGKSPAPARSASPARMLIPRRRKPSAPPQPPPEKILQQYLGEQLIARSGSLHPGEQALAPLVEGPDAKHLTPATPTPRNPAAGRGSGTGCAATSRARRPCEGRSAGKRAQDADAEWECHGKITQRGVRYE